MKYFIDITLFYNPAETNKNFLVKDCSAAVRSKLVETKNVELPMPNILENESANESSLTSSFTLQKCNVMIEKINQLC